MITFRIYFYTWSETNRGLEELYSVCKLLPIPFGIARPTGATLELRVEFCALPDFQARRLLRSLMRLGRVETVVDVGLDHPDKTVIAMGC